MLTQYFHTDSRASCKNFEGLFGGVELWQIHWNSPNSPTFSPAKVLHYMVCVFDTDGQIASIEVFQHSSVKMQFILPVLDNSMSEML